MMLGLCLTLAACSSSFTVYVSAPTEAIQSPTPPTLPVPALPDLGPAPELTNEIWLNAEAPLRLRDLAGKVVLLEFWTFG
jgi:hypothetical protein